MYILNLENYIKLNTLYKREDKLNLTSRNL